MAAEQKPARAEPSEVVRRGGQDRQFQPATDIIETADAVVLKLDVPGVAKENVDPTVDKAEQVRPRKVKIATAG